MTFWKWSRTASANATADSTCPFPEGMAPSAVNDGVRALMAAAAKYRDDTSGALITGGTSSAYTLTTNQGFTGPIADGTGLAFWAHATNAAGATLNVDGTGAAPFMAPIAVSLPAGVLVAGTPYRIRYTTIPGWVLEGVLGGPYAIPIGGFLPYLSTTPPSSSFVLPYGQPINRTTYATLFSMIGTTFGVGDGSTTFNIPDLRGRLIAGMDNMGGVAIGRITSVGGGIDGTVLGASGGSQNKALVTANLPPYTPAGTININDPTHAHPVSGGNGLGSSGSPGQGFAGGGQFAQPINVSNASTGLNSSNVTFAGNAQGGTSSPMQVMPPTMVLPMLLRVL